MQMPRCIIPAKRFHNGSREGVAEQVGRKNLPVEFPAAIEPRQAQIERKIQERVIKLGRMYR